MEKRNKNYKPSTQKESLKIEENGGPGLGKRRNS
jgi:hypothetical protein